MNRAFPLFFGAAIVMTACGGGGSPAANAPDDGDDHHHHGEHMGEHMGERTGEHGEEHGEHGEHHPKMDADVHAFHEVLGPVFHMDKGAARADKACEAVTPMKDAGAKVAASRGSDDAKAKATQLGAAVDALSTACAATDHAGVEAQLDAVHHAFHEVMEAH